MNIEWKYLWIRFGPDCLRVRDCNFMIMLLPRPDLGESCSMIPHLFKLEFSWNWPTFRMYWSHIPKNAYKEKK